MRVRLAGIFFWVCVLAVAAGAFAQATASRPAVTRPATRAASAPIPKNVERALQSDISIDADNIPFASLIGALRQVTNTNIVVNWNALAAAGVTRDTPVTLHMRQVQYEAVVKALIEVLPFAATRANYDVGENILEFTTNAALSRAASMRLRPFDRGVNYSFDGKAEPEEREANGKVLALIFEAELRRAMEPIDEKKQVVAVRNGTVAALVSDRGSGVLERAMNLIINPMKPSQLAMGTQLTSYAKHAQEAMKNPSIAGASMVDIARHPETYAISTAFMPKALAELKKPEPKILGTIDDGGVLLLGTPDEINARTVMSVYDARDVMKRLAAEGKLSPPPSATDYQEAIVESLKQTVNATITETVRWLPAEELVKNPTGWSIIPYNGMLIVFAPPDVHRTVTTALHEMMK